MAFSNCSSLEEVDLPHTENLLIERDAFENCSALNTIRAYTEKTDSISIENAFEKTLFDKCILYIPSGSRWAYKHHPVLGRFKNILIEK